MLTARVKLAIVNNQPLSQLLNGPGSRKLSLKPKVSNTKSGFESTASIMFARKGSEKENMPPMNLLMAKKPKKRPSTKMCLIKINNKALLSLIRPSSKNTSPAGSPIKPLSRSLSKQRQGFLSTHHALQPELERVPQSEILAGMLEAEKQNIQYGCLKSQNIKSAHRARMVNWMVEVMSAYNFTKRSYFLACAIMDNFFRISPKKYVDEDVHITGIISMYLASKIEEIQPMFLNELYYNVGHEAISVSTMKQKELEMLKVLGYKVIHTTAIQFLYFYLNLTGETGRVKDSSVAYLIMAQYDPDMLKYPPSILAAGAIKAAKAKSTSIKVIESTLKGKLIDINECADALKKLESEFETKFAGLKNAFHYQMID